MDTTELAAGQLLVIDDGAPQRLRVLRGRLWLTRERDTADTVLHAGDEAVLGCGRSVAEALAASRVLRVPAAAPAAGARVWLRWRRAVHRARACVAGALARWQLGPPSCC